MDFHLDNFDGPLDLLLHLISKNKVSIYDIPIAEILEQYMAVLHEAEHMDLDVAGDFIAMAAQLVYIKSRMLLPKHEEDEAEEDPRAGLVEMLLEYQRLKSATAFFAEKNETGRDIYVKPPERQDDAAQTGILLGQTAALCGIIVPFLENTFDMQDYHVSADADFNADHTEWAFTVNCSIRPISLVRVLLRHGKPMYKLYKKYFK